MFPDWIIKINREEIDTAAFQKYINFAKLQQGQQGVGIDKIIADKSELNTFLNKFIELHIILHEAEEKGYSIDNEEVNAVYRQQKKNWIQRLFLMKDMAKETSSIEEPTEEEIKSFFNQYYGESQKAYADLSMDEKSKVYQAVLMQKIDKAKKIYKKRLEKEYRIKRYGMDKKNVALVDRTRITRSQLNRHIKDQLSLMGVSPEEVKARSPQKYKQYKEEAYEDLIFQTMVQKEMAIQDFTDKQYVQDALDVLQDQVVLEYFIEKEIKSGITVNDTERDQVYQKIKARIKDLPFPQQQEVINEQVKRAKLDAVLQTFLSEKKEEMIIKRNKDELEKIN
ncbi:MAG TPA: hypothetical protein VKS21_01235 [Spirochaetota bacterium]|nr:hypothetical protein [Spirochaetota bacterium]